ncbi:diguanylate cyclase [Thiohalospira sp.]|uniref:GGDEF domain-containing protein n=1 Tax=Thiohalospira sp. TaxID=3080549 RepID=UPI00397E9B79
MRGAWVTAGYIRRWRLPLVLLLVLTLFTAIGVVSVLQQQRGLLQQQAQTAGESELAIIASFSREALVRGDYAAVARFVEEYAEGHHRVRRLRMVSGDGAYTWVDFEAPDAPDAGEGDTTQRFEQRIDYGAGRALTIELVRSGRQEAEALAQLRRSLVVGGVVGVLLFTGVLWFSVERMGLRPLRRARDHLEARVAERTRELEYRANHDYLTGLDNRLKFEEFLEAETERAERYGDPFSLILCDIDHFKWVNDTYGHNVGDEVLVELARRFTTAVRRVDRVARWGGEEFAILLPDTGLAAAEDLAERLRRVVAESPFPTVGSVTMSFGVTARRSGDSQQRLLLRADQALYQAKEEGRNRVVGRAE